MQPPKPERDFAKEFVYLQSISQIPHKQEREMLFVCYHHNNLSPKLREIVFAAAIPHYFDKEIVEAVLGKNITENEYAELLDLSFIGNFPSIALPEETQYRDVHELTRLSLLRASKKGRIELGDREFRRMSANAYSYFRPTVYSTWKYNAHELTFDFKKMAEASYHMLNARWPDSNVLKVFKELIVALLDNNCHSRAEVLVNVMREIQSFDNDSSIELALQEVERIFDEYKEKNIKQYYIPNHTTP